jgi:PKD repeat protein
VVSLRLGSTGGTIIFEEPGIYKVTLTVEDDCGDSDTASQPQGAFKNLTVSSKTIKTLDDILKKPSWRQNAQKFLVNISDVQYPEFNNPQKAAVIYSRLLSNGIYFNVLGTGTNRSQAQSIIV